MKHNQPTSIGWQKGVYQLLVYLPQSAYIEIGKKGTFRFPKGYYVYTGSAKSGLKGRVERHLRKEKKRFWHIDYLLNHALVKQVFLFPDEMIDECSLSRKMLKKSEAKVIVPKFGASDCNCPTHLVFFGRLTDVPKDSRAYSLFCKGVM
jgi:Uri superfamily endonuclease